jgi:hypothetical protein
MQTQMAQKPMMRAEVRSVRACVARELNVKRAEVWAVTLRERGVRRISAQPQCRIQRLFSPVSLIN